MAMRVSIDDTDEAISITLSASGGYSPDCMHDLKARAVETYRDALVTKYAVTSSIEDDSET
jgi:hypothetical protein